MLMAVFCVTAMSAQMRTVTGVVTSAEDGEPLAGATVVPVGGNGHGTATDLDGRFTLQVPQSIHKLTVSYVGMRTKSVDITPGEMKIELENTTNKLDEVMVVAYGTAKKSAFTGSATVVDADVIEKSQVSNALDALTGRVAGVQISNASGQPGESDPTIYIRGITSLTARNNPLIVVNGAPYPGDITTINPADIASMTVLKDAASNALYGARGANGVILITTKKAQLGSGAVVTLDAKWGANSRAVQEYNTVNDPKAYYELYYKSLYNLGVNQGMNHIAANVFANQNLISGGYGLGYQVYTVPDGQYLIGTDGKFNPYATLGYIATNSRTGEQFMLRPDSWLDAAYKTSLRQEYNVSVTNGTEYTQFYFSAGYLNNEGITPNSGFERFTSRLTADTQAKPWLKVGADLGYTHYNAKTMSEDGVSNSSGNIFAAATQVAPIYPLYVRDVAGNILTNSDGVTMFDYSNGSNAGLHRPVYDMTNAIGDAILNTNKYQGNAFSGQGYFEIRFLKDFKFTSNNSVNFDERGYTYITNPYFGTYASSNGIIEKDQTKDLSYAFQQLLTWNHTFGGKHEVDILAGHENYWQISSVLYASKTNMFDPTNEELNGAVTDGSMGSYTTKYNNEGWLFRGQYNYNEKYFASLSYRRDASSRFAPDKRWGNFWSAGAAWIISKESFFKAGWVDLLKLKVSYGEQGNDNIGNFLYTNTYNIVNGVGNPAAVPYIYGNPDLTWEKNGNLNYGIEFDLFNSRLSGSIEGFYRKTTDMLFWFTLPPSLGWTGYYANIGDMTNNGIEIDLNGILYQSRNISWSLNFNLTWYKNKLAYMPEARKTLEVEGYRGYESGNYFFGEGLPLYTFEMPRYAYPDPETGEALYYKKVIGPDGNPTGELETTAKYSEADYFLCGSALPKVYGGFGTTFTAYGFDLSVDFNYSLGGKIYDSSYAQYMTPPTSDQRGQALHADLLNSWSAENTGSDIPRLQFNDTYTAATSDRFLTSANYLNLRNINLGYSLPQKVINKIKLTKLRFYLQCENVWYWSARKGLDPRQSITGSNTNTYYSPIRTISGGLTVTF